MDVIISNCVINLAPDKSKVFKEAYRVLKNRRQNVRFRYCSSWKAHEEQLKDEDLLIGLRCRRFAKRRLFGKIKQAGFTVNIVGEDKEISKTQYNGLALESIKIEALK